MARTVAVYTAKIRRHLQVMFALGQSHPLPGPCATPLPASKKISGMAATIAKNS
jgi:hypothetical protein